MLEDYNDNTFCSSRKIRLINSAKSAKSESFKTLSLIRLHNFNLKLIQNLLKNRILMSTKSNFYQLKKLLKDFILSGTKLDLYQINIVNIVNEHSRKV